MRCRCRYLLSQVTAISARGRAFTSCLESSGCWTCGTRPVPTSTSLLVSPRCCSAPPRMGSRSAPSSSSWPSPFFRCVALIEAPNARSTESIHVRARRPFPCTNSGNAAVTKFLISIPVSPPVPSPEDRNPTAPLRESRWGGDPPVSASVMSLPRMEELIHLDFGTDDAVT